MIMDMENTASTQLNHHYDNKKAISDTSDNVEIEFDGNTVLCRVCGDRASGFHYGVHACEGCKGFFRRSIQQKIQYRPCLKNQLCLITRINRNRCQYCRLKKCIAVGMSRDAVRFGRVPKREKAKILEQMQRVNDVQCRSTAIDAVLGSSSQLINNIVHAHMATCEFTKAKVKQFKQAAWFRGEFVHCPAQMACPLNPAPDLLDCAQKWDQFTDCFMPAIRNIVNFAKFIPGFSMLSQEDQVMLLKIGTFEVLLVHLTSLFDSKTNTMLFTNGRIYKRTSLASNTGAGYLLDSLFDFSERFNELDLTDEEIALFSALILITSDRPGLRGVELVERIQSRLTDCLQTVVSVNHSSDRSVFTKLILKLSELRLLNTIHSEKLLGLSLPLSSYPSTTMSQSVQQSSERQQFRSNHTNSFATNVVFKEEPKSNKMQMNSDFKNEANGGYECMEYNNGATDDRDEFHGKRIKRNLSENDGGEKRRGFGENGRSQIIETGDFTGWKDSSNRTRNSAAAQAVSTNDQAWGSSPQGNGADIQRQQRSPMFHSIKEYLTDTRQHRGDDEIKYTDARTRNTCIESNSHISTVPQSAGGHFDVSPSANSPVSSYSSTTRDPPPFSQYTRAPHNGAAVIGHLTSKRVQPCELLLTTPLGSFHRMPSSMWLANNNEVEAATERFEERQLIEERQLMGQDSRLLEQITERQLIRHADNQINQLEEFRHQTEKLLEEQAVKQGNEVITGRLLGGQADRQLEELTDRQLREQADQRFVEQAYRDIVGQTGRLGDKRTNKEILQQSDGHSANNVDKHLGEQADKQMSRLADRRLVRKSERGYENHQNQVRRFSDSPNSIDSLAEMPKLIEIRRTKNKVMRTWCEDEDGADDTGSGGDCIRSCSNESSTSTSVNVPQDVSRDSSTSQSALIKSQLASLATNSAVIGEQETSSVGRHLDINRKENHSAPPINRSGDPMQQEVSAPKRKYSAGLSLGPVQSQSQEDTECEGQENFVIRSQQRQSDMLNRSYTDFSAIGSYRRRTKQEEEQQADEIASATVVAHSSENIAPIIALAPTPSSSTSSSSAGRDYDTGQLDITEKDERKSSDYDVTSNGHFSTNYRVSNSANTEAVGENSEKLNDRARSPRTNELTADLLRTGYRLDILSHGGGADRDCNLGSIQSASILQQTLPQLKGGGSQMAGVCPQRLAVPITSLNLDEIPAPRLYPHSFHPAAILYNHLALQLHAAQQHQQQQQQQLMSQVKEVESVVDQSTADVAETTNNGCLDEKSNGN